MSQVVEEWPTGESRVSSLPTAVITGPRRVDSSALSEEFAAEEVAVAHPAVW